MSLFRQGRYDADELIDKAPEAVDHWLTRARRSRRRWRTRLFEPRKRRYLEGFIGRLEQFRLLTAGAGRLPDSTGSCR